MQKIKLQERRKKFTENEVKFEDDIILLEEEKDGKEIKFISLYMPIYFNVDDYLGLMGINDDESASASIYINIYEDGSIGNIITTWKNDDIEEYEIELSQVEKTIISRKARKFITRELEMTPEEQFANWED